MVWQNYDRKLAKEPKVDAKGLRLINDGIWQRFKSDLELKLYKKRDLTRKRTQFENSLRRKNSVLRRQFENSVLATL